MHRRRWLARFVVLTLAFAAALASVPAAAATSSDPLAQLGLRTSDFGGPINNPYFPLIPGTTYDYAGLSGGVPFTDVFEVTHNTKMIMGVKTVEILDRGWLNGSLEERTLDWFAQDKNRNVWYFGEFATQISNGVVTGHDGSWQGGKNGALPGIVMEGHPKVGDTYNQENAAPIAEDSAKVLSLNAPVNVPFGSFPNALKTKEFSALDPEVEHKFYGKGVGEIRAETVGSASTDFTNLLIVTKN
jgi:hypothetical protein